MYTLKMTSDAFRYRDEQVDGVCPGAYDPLVPASQFCDRVSQIVLVWMTHDKNQYSDQTLHMICLMDTTNGPGCCGGVFWDVAMGHWDAEFGHWLGREGAGAVWGLTTASASPSRAGEMFRTSTLAPHPLERYTKTLDYIETIYASHFTSGGVPGDYVRPGAHDPQSNVSVCRIDYLDAPDVVGVYEYASGVRLGGVQVPGNVKNVFFGPRDSAYVVTGEGLLTTINYRTFEVLGISRLFGTPGVPWQVYGYDDFRKRLLFSEAIPDEPVTGISNVRIRGYHPVPIATALTPPIPIQAPKEGRTIQIMTRAYGDAGEGITGLTIDQTPTGPGIVTPASRSTDGTGYALFNCACDATGAQQIDLEATV